MYNRSCPEVKSKLLFQELAFASRLHRTVLPPRGACKGAVRTSGVEFIKKLRRGNEWPDGLATGMEVSFVSLRHSSFRQPCLMGSVN